jgi:PAS domain S-box-containing protein
MSQKDFFGHKSTIFYQVVKDLNEAVMITDKNSKLVYVNPAWEKIYEYSIDEILGKSPKVISSGFHDEKFYSEMWNSILDPNKRYWQGEVINKSKTGKLIPVLLSISYFCEPNEEFEGFIGIALNLTESKQLQAQVLHQDRLASIGMFASGLAHEIGTPLGVIRGRAELLSIYVQDETTKNTLQIIITQIDRISKLIESLLKITRSSSDLNLKSISYKDVVLEVCSFIERDLKKNDITLDVKDLLDEKVMADYNRCEQIILNFVTNAIYAINVVKKSNPKHQGVLKFSTKVNLNQVELIVSDNGCGISKENLKKLFQPFFTTKEVGEGTGLGLAIVSKLIYEMHGSVRVESEENMGSSFIISLPKA